MKNTVTLKHQERRKDDSAPLEWLTLFGMKKKTFSLPRRTWVALNRERTTMELGITMEIVETCFTSGVGRSSDHVIVVLLGKQINISLMTAQFDVTEVYKRNV